MRIGCRPPSVVPKCPCFYRCNFLLFLTYLLFLLWLIFRQSIVVLMCSFNTQHNRKTFIQFRPRSLRVPTPTSDLQLLTSDLSVRQHKKPNGEDRGVPEGYVAVPGGAVVSERFTNITNTHEESDNVREEEEVHHLGQYSNDVS